MMTREGIIVEAKTWLNTPYHHQGRIKGVGVDCAMLLADVYNKCGFIPYIDPRPYPPDWHIHKSEEKYLGWVKQHAIEVAEPKPGDVALFQFGRCTAHGAIVVEWPMIIHAYIRVGCVIGDANSGVMAGRCRGFYSVFKDQQ
jgi:cell wall-associated NlpC family hydrolase